MSTLRIIPGPHPDEPAFQVMVSSGVLRPSNFPAIGTAYSAVGFQNKPRIIEGWENWKFAFWEPENPESQRVGGSSEILFTFFKNIPSTPIAADGIELALWGPAKRWTYVTTVGSALPQRGGTFSTSSTTLNLTLNSGADLTLNGGGTLSLNSSEFVYDAEETETRNGITKVVVTTLPINQVTRLIDTQDTDTGDIITVNETHYLTGTRPTAAPMDSSGNYELVTPVSFNIWKKESGLITALPGPGSPRTNTRTGRSPIVWPAVLLSYQWLTVLRVSLTTWEHRLSYVLGDAYTGDVVMTEEEWWQKDPPAARAPTEMLATRINIDLKWGNAIAIPDCLHSEFVAAEQLIAEFFPEATPRFYINSAGSITNMKEVYHRVPATNYTDWPDTVVKQDSVPYKGGYKVTRLTIYKPTAARSGATIEVNNLYVTPNSWYGMFNEYNFT